MAENAKGSEPEKQAAPEEKEVKKDEAKEGKLVSQKEYDDLLALYKKPMTRWANGKTNTISPMPIPRTCGRILKKTISSDQVSGRRLPR
jgi:hypothetical protein